MERVFCLISESSAKYAVAYYYRYSKKTLPPGSLIASMAIPSENANSIWNEIGGLVAHAQHKLDSKREFYSDQVQVWYSHNSNFSLFSTCIQIRANFRALALIASEEFGAPHDMFDGTDLRGCFNIYEVQEGVPLKLIHMAENFKFGEAVSSSHSSFSI